MNIVTLSNGRKVGNFSSPHPFEFEDGNVLPAVSSEEAERLKVDFIEYQLNQKGDIKLEFAIGDAIRDEISKWLRLHVANKVDIVYCPLPMIKAMSNEFTEEFVLMSPFRTIRMVDRIKKLVSIEKQCI